MKEHQFPWTPGGLELLETINREIEESGGRSVLYDTLKAELNDSSYSKEKARTQEVIRLTVRHNIPLKQAHGLIPMGYTKFVKLVSEYKNSRL